MGYQYEVINKEFSAKEDFPSGGYDIERSNAAMSLMKIIKNAFEGDFSKYLSEGKQVKVIVTGSADASPIRGRIAYVPQKAWLFSGTVASNLRFGNEDATEADMLHALRVAQSTFVLDQPQGLDTPVAQGGTNFSGGQRQRLAIARALMKHADLYIFDDSFSALDFKTDAALRHALQDETRDAAVLIIAQRISTILHADQIVVLKDGEVVGLGTHGELMETCEVYRAIAESQMKGGE